MDVVARDRLDGDELAAALAITSAATGTDGVTPLGEASLIWLRDGGGAVLAYQDGTPAGLAVVTGGAGELVVHPAHRRRGIGRALARAVLEPGARFWAHGELPGAVALAASLGLERFRALWQMRRPLAIPLPEVAPPPDVRLRTFRVGSDEEAWLRVNARAFASHPEQGGWTRADLERREREPWFSPEGFFLAERAGRIVGFHWTKVHDRGAAIGLGEVYVLAVDPAEHGRGLGRTLTVVGLEHLRALGVPTVLLYVEESNRPAVHLYERLGFAHRSTDAMYRPPNGHMTT